jgi:DNA-binding transcriptional LysR family regulator
MRRHIPSLSALQAFESAGRLSSFTRAARELNVSQSAISRHIRSLEEELGVTLFQRIDQRVSLTPAGSRYIRAIRGCLDEIEASTFDLKTERHDSGAIHLITPPTIGARWLVPRLPEFMSRYPEIQLRLSVRADPVDFGNAVFDAAIAFGEQPPTTIGFERLTEGELIAVCSPRLGLRPKANLTLGQLTRYKLLELGNDHSWRTLCQQSRVRPFDEDSILRYEYFDAGIQSAISGEGILLVQPFLVIEHLKNGALTLASLQRYKSELSYYFCFTRPKRISESIKLFASWLKDEFSTTAKICDTVLQDHLTTHVLEAKTPTRHQALRVRTE